MVEDLKIIQKTYDLTLYLYQATQNFPRSEKFTLSSMLRGNCFKLISLFTEANYTRDKRKYLAEADSIIHRQKILCRLAKDLGILPFRKYEILSGGWVEIGKMTGGWIISLGRDCKG